MVVARSEVVGCAGIFDFGTFDRFRPQRSDVLESLISAPSTAKNLDFPHETWYIVKKITKKGMIFYATKRREYDKSRDVVFAHNDKR